jgi:hypothetical protein
MQDERFDPPAVPPAFAAPARLPASRSQVRANGRIPDRFAGRSRVVPGSSSAAGLPAWSRLSVGDADGSVPIVAFEVQCVHSTSRRAIFGTNIGGATSMAELRRYLMARSHRAFALVVSALLTVGCSASPQLSDGAPTEGPSASAPAPVGGFPRCGDVPPIAAPADWYRDSPIYVGNEMPVEAVQQWASRQPGFQDLWIDRGHHGWITVGFTAAAEARQADLEREFPGVGVVAVTMDRPKAELEALQQRVQQHLIAHFPIATYGLIDHGVVGVGLGVLSDERLALLEEAFAGEPICVDGADPADVPKPGPQAAAGDGWRLLADEQAGDVYRTGIAWDEPSLATLWREIPLPGDPPAVDFASEVVIWFGAVYGSSCPNLRLDAVIFDHPRTLVYADIVNVDVVNACTADANPRAYVVAVDRSRLPAPPFGIQLGESDPPAGVPEERTIVDADLRVPGSVAAPVQVHGDPRLPAPQIAESGTFFEPDFPGQYRLRVHCGIEWLGVINDITWRTEVPDGAVDFVPPQWEPLVAEESIVVEVLLDAGDPPTITATANGHSVTYLPATEDAPGCD